jgi:GT2 family glycosyltransferase
VRLSVIILNYNVSKFLQQCLYSVTRAVQGIDAEIIVVDNASSDDSCLMVRSLFPEVILIENQENYGFPKGNNVAAAKAKGEFLCILNPDTVVAEDTFIKTLAFHESRPNAGITGVKLIDGAGNFLPESKRGIPTPFTAFTKITGLYKLSPRLFGKYYAQHLSPARSGPVEILVGAFMVLTRRLYQELEGFDQACFMYADDIDLSYRALQLGYQNYYFADTAVIHYKGESTVRDRLYIDRFREAMAFFYQKHFRTYGWFDLFMRVGAVVFARMKAGVKEPSQVKPKAFYLMAAREAFCTYKESVINEPLEYLSLDADTIPVTPCRIFFDAGSLSYAEIIRKMQSVPGQDVSFRMLYAAEGFFIGSDSSNSRGEVVATRKLERI